MTAQTPDPEKIIHSADVGWYGELVQEGPQTPGGKGL